MMNEKELYNYKMTEDELQKWCQFQNQIISDCRQVEIPSSFSEYIKTQVNPIEPYIHTAGYCNNVGYFYITEGDRGEIFLKCLSFNLENIRWYIMEKILTHIGQQLELQHRKPEENGNWIYNAVYDSRKYWFEYAIASLSKIFNADRINPYVTDQIDLMNRWFDVPHWDFSYEKMCFVEINDSRE